MEHKKTSFVQSIGVFFVVLFSLFGLTALLMLPIINPNPWHTSPATSESTSSSSTTTSTTTKTPISDQPEGPKNIGAEVQITNLLQFEPHQVTIKAGQAVRWTNTSFDMHTVTADASLAADASHVLLPDGAEPFNSGLIAPEKTFGKTFSVPGRYRYFCIPHEATGMVGEVIVTGNQTTPKTNQ